MDSSAECTSAAWPGGRVCCCGSRAHRAGCGMRSASPESAPGGGLGRAAASSLGRRAGHSRISSQPDSSTGPSSQPSNPSSGARVIKRCTNCESPSKKIKSSVSPPRPHACMRSPQEPLSWQSREPCAEPESPRRTRLCAAGGSLGSPAARAQRGGRQEVGGARLTQVSSTSRTHPSPTVRAPA